MKNPILQDILKDVEEDTEYLETTEGDEVECISIENLKAILTKHFKENESSKD